MNLISLILINKFAFIFLFGAFADFSSKVVKNSRFQKTNQVKQPTKFIATQQQKFLKEMVCEKFSKNMSVGVSRTSLHPIVEQGKQFGLEQVTIVFHNGLPRILTVEMNGSLV